MCSTAIRADSGSDLADLFHELPTPTHAEVADVAGRTENSAPTILLVDPPPGQEVQVDFGKMGMVVDPARGRVRMLWAHIVTLSFSRNQFVWPTFAQTTAAVCEGLDRAWWFFGAMSKTMVPDNTRAMIKERDRCATGGRRPTRLSRSLD